MGGKDRNLQGLALKVGIAGAIGFAAVATGLFVSRRGRHLMREAWQGRRRTRLEDRVLDALWGDPTLSRREIDVQELDAAMVELTGQVRSEEERRRAVSIAEQVKTVQSVSDKLLVVPPARRSALQFRRGSETDPSTPS